MPDNSSPSHLTSEVQQSEALRRQAEQFFEATTDAVFFLDREYRFTFLNRRAKELVSLGQDLIGRNLFEQFPQTAAPGSPFLENYRRTMEQGLPGDFESFYPDPFKHLVPRAKLSH